MIIEKAKKSVVQSHEFAQVNCTIDAEDMRYVASLLRNNYSDQMVAIIREISANALDANIEANIDRKVEVHVPSVVNPNFSVRDFGNGLSEQEMFELYSKYGKSTKRTSNTYIGAFGIGKFAPLSYGDNFTVVSRNEGKKTTYNIYVDENDDTKIVKLNSEFANEASGLEVKVAIADDDINRFNEKVASFFKYFNEEEMPDFFGLPTGIEKVEKVLEGEGWFLEECEGGYSRYSYHSNSHAVMGRVRYPINTESMNLDNEEDGSTISNLLSQNNLHIEFEIGSLKLHHSRESLEYNKSTQEMLINRAKEVMIEIEKIAQEKLGGAEDLWDAKLKYAQIINSIPSNLRSLLQNSFSWNGIKISSPTFNSTFMLDDDRWQVKVHRYEKDEADDVSDGFRVVNRKSDKLYCKEGSIIAIADCPSHGLSQRARTLFLEDEDLVEVQVLNFDEEVGSEKAFRKHHSFDEVNSDHVVNFSEVEKAVLASRASIKQGRSRVPLKELEIDAWKDNVRSNWSDSDNNVDDLTFNADECIYFATKGNRIVREGDDPCDEAITLNRMKGILKMIRNRLKADEKTLPIVYGIQVKQCKKLEKTVWKNGFDWITEQISELMTDEILEAYGEHDVTSSAYDIEIYSELSDIISNEEMYKMGKSTLGKNHILTKLTKMFTVDVEANRQTMGDIEHLIGFYNEYNPDLALKPEFTLGNLKSMVNQLDKEYPMLKHVYLNWHCSAKVSVDVGEYVQFVDSGKKCLDAENSS